MIIKSAGIKAGVRRAREALHKRGICFRNMRSKPLLTKADVATRLAFAKKYRKKTKKWWQTWAELYIDLKNNPVYTNAASRGMGAQREVRGAYRKLSTPR